MEDQGFESVERWAIGGFRTTDAVVISKRRNIKKEIRLP